jgi:hypothetical protein
MFHVEQLWFRRGADGMFHVEHCFRFPDTLPITECGGANLFAARPGRRSLRRRRLFHVKEQIRRSSYPFCLGSVPRGTPIKMELTQAVLN